MGAGEQGGCVFDKEDDARAMVENEGEDNEAPLEIAAEKMHREVFENLGRVRRILTEHHAPRSR